MHVNTEPGYFLRRLLRGWLGEYPHWIALNFLATFSYPDTSPFFFFFPTVHCASSPVTRVSRWPLCQIRSRLGRWQSSDTEQVACSRRSDRGDAWNRLLDMSFIIKVVRPKQMFFFPFLFFSRLCFGNFVEFSCCYK